MEFLGKLLLLSVVVFSLNGCSMMNDVMGGGSTNIYTNPNAHKDPLFH